MTLEFTKRAHISKEYFEYFVSSEPGIPPMALGMLRLLNLSRTMNLAFSQRHTSL